MRNKFLAVFLVVVLILGGRSFAYACGGGCGCGARKAEGQEIKESLKAIEVKNKVCPVMGGTIVDEKAVKVEHEGRVYRLCCAECILEFKSDPEKYIEKLNGMAPQEPAMDSCNAVHSCQG